MRLADILEATDKVIDDQRRLNITAMIDERLDPDVIEQAERAGDLQNLRARLALAEQLLDVGGWTAADLDTLRAWVQAHQDKLRPS